MRGWYLSGVSHGFDLEHPRFDLVFREPSRWPLSVPSQKKAVSLRFNISDDIEEVIRELRRVAFMLEKEIL